MPTYNQPTNYLIMYPVKGEEGAAAYPVAPGGKVTLIDTDNAIIYVKSTNQFGQMLPLEVYDLVYRKPPEVNTPQAAPQIDREELVRIVDESVRNALHVYFPSMNFGKEG